MQLCTQNFVCPMFFKNNEVFAKQERGMQLPATYLFPDCNNVTLNEHLMDKSINHRTNSIVTIAC